MSGPAAARTDAVTADRWDDVIPHSSRAARSLMDGLRGSLSARPATATDLGVPGRGQPAAAPAGRAGAFWDAIVGMGGTRRTPPGLSRALGDAVAVRHTLWSTDRSARVSGEHHLLRGAHPGPGAAHDTGIRIDGHKPRMPGRIGDGWPPGSPTPASTRRRPENAGRLCGIAEAFAGGSSFGGRRRWLSRH
ncbi:hypothetical protein Drose_17615 [Dactylosporangium roseum]|uniref:Uncharacterized protein n=1 Tax=Dactylosporangium roseum TaxID=47989 RepID=A0ABY5ZCK3_9ACTN|nr:hypothetical protein [Dactylosporangium roseum]UWZ39861.1 hypothetical protein Drose_17615 [Dactylosporangium roseum]